MYKESYVLYNHVMTPLATQLERKPRKDHGTRRGCHSTSSSTFNEPSSSHLNDDDDDDGNNEGTSRASTPSPIRYLRSAEIQEKLENFPCLQRKASINMGRPPNISGCLDEAVIGCLDDIIMVFYCLLSEFGTDDRTNDALELHEADIGLAIGIAGTEEEKESADVIILDNFSTTEDEVQRISKSVFVTNFPKVFSVKDLWNTCKQYGQVFDVERLVNSLCTVWVGRYKLHANIPRFQREPFNKHSNLHNNFGKKRGSSGAGNNNNRGLSNPKGFRVDDQVRKANGNFNPHPSYVGVVKQKMMFQQNRDDDNNPSIMLDDSCVLQCDYSLSLTGKVLDFSSLSNLKMVLTKEGFENFNLKYLGGFWVLIAFCCKQALEKFKSHVRVGSRFSSLEYASNMFLIDERVVWVDIEGVPLKVWMNNTYNKVSSKWGEMLFQEDKKNVCLNSKRVCITTKLENNIFESFKIIVNRKVFLIRAKEVCVWVPNFLEDEEEGDESDKDTFDDEFGKDDSKAHMNFNSEGDSDKKEIQETVFSSHKAESKGRDDINDVDDVIISEDPFKIYDLLEKQKLQGNNVEDDISNGTINYPPGFTPVEEGDMKTVKVDILNGVKHGCTQNANEQVNNVEEKNNKGMSSSKEEDKESRCLGHFRSVEGPQTRGSILQLLDDVVKNYWGNLSFEFECCPSVGNSSGILCVWDPRTFRKQNSTFSNYFVAIQGVWIPNAKKCILISVYAPQEVFEKRMLWSYLNHVINNWSGETIIMGDFNEVRGSSVRGCAFTWCHKSGNKMSKLDRFLILEGLMGTCPNISAITLDRCLSDHRPILLREVSHDYGPISFRLFHYWFEWKGFDELVKDTWKKSTITDNNVISKFMKKLKLLKEQIRLFVRAKKEVHACKGDENSNYFHGILNKKRNQNAIRGILAEGVWIDDPNLVKNVFLSHFKERFDRPSPSCLILDITFPNRLNLDQIDDLERNLTKEEIKRAVWDCGMFPKGGNASFIALIPKMQDAKVVKDFRPISLIGLRMNLQKSKLLGIAVDDEKVSRAAMKMGCCTLTPFSNLGIKVGGMMTRIKSWDEIVVKLHSRLSKWKLKTLSIGGRLTLLKSVLGSTPIYYMSMFKVPSQVLKCLEDTRRQFLMGLIQKKKSSREQNGVGFWL
nr:RNA-directed DNA polymerase, eukaryota, nucleotide-binding alpha-beta plait domain protein [Tanacetum cinerariifolium]